MLCCERLSLGGVLQDPVDERSSLQCSSEADGAITDPELSC